jgi:hypothetical protein
VPLFLFCICIIPSLKYFCQYLRESHFSFINFFLLLKICEFWSEKQDKLWANAHLWYPRSSAYAILWEAFLDPSASYFLFADLIGFYTHWTYMHIFRHIFLSNYWRQKSDIWSQASYRYPISWEVFFDPSDSYFLFAEERGYHKWALAHSLSCFSLQNSQIFRRRKKLIKEKWDRLR